MPILAICHASELQAISLTKKTKGRILQFCVQTTKLCPVDSLKLICRSECSHIPLELDLNNTMVANHLQVHNLQEFRYYISSELAARL
jgi:hypothetical protein